MTCDLDNRCSGSEVHLPWGACHDGSRAQRSAQIRAIAALDTTITSHAALGDRLISNPRDT